MTLSQRIAEKTDPLQRDIERAKDMYLHAPTPAERAKWLQVLEALVRNAG